MASNDGDSGCGCLILAAIILICCSQCHESLPTPSTTIKVACEQQGKVLVRSAVDDTKFYCIAGTLPDAK